MKKILLSICLAPFMLVAVELHPEDDCLELKENLSTIWSDLNSSVQNGLWSSVMNLNTLNYLVNDSIGSFKTSGDNATDEYVKQAYYNCANDYSLNLASSISSNAFYTAYASWESATNSTRSLLTLNNSIDCTQCSSTNTNCCDFTEIIQEIDRVAVEVNMIQTRVSNINSLMTEYYSRFQTRLDLINSAIRSGFLGVTNLLWQVDTKLDSLTNTVYSGFDSLTNILTQSNNLLASNNSALVSGFGNTTNLLSAIYGVDSSGWGVATNYLNLMYISDYYDEWVWQPPEMLTHLSYPSFLNGRFDRFYSGLVYFNNDKWQYSSYAYGLAPTVYLILQEMLGGMYAQNSWTQYQHDFMYPPVTNILTSIYVAQTNYFSFFRGEVGVNGVLADWTPQQGNYYDFLTNHYLAVVRGDTLSASLSSKTNWFSRIETLLSALVFADASSTNTVNTSAGQQEQSDLSSSLSSLNSNASQVSSDFSTSSTSIITLYQLWAANFDTAALPSHVVMFTLSNTDENDSVSFNLSDHPGLVAFVEGCRAITTFCWASVGIFLLYRFMVWCARCVYVACRFLYSVISAIFK